MHTTRLASALAIASILLAACGSGSAATQQPAGATASTGGGGGGGSATQAPADTQAAEATNAGGGSGSGSGDVQAVANQLVAPNSTEISKTTAEDTRFVIYRVHRLRRLAEALLRGRDCQGGAERSSPRRPSRAACPTSSRRTRTASFGGSVNIYPSGDGKTAVQVTVARS